MKIDYSKCDQLDLARLAAYFDGEGSIFIVTCAKSRNKGRTELRVTISNTDIRLMEWLKQRFGGHVSEKRSTPKWPRKWKTCWQWLLVSNQAARVLEACMPYFVIKSEQAQIALAHQRLVAKVLQVPGIQRKAVADSIHEERELLRIKLSEIKGTCGLVHRNSSSSIQ